MPYGSARVALGANDPIIEITLKLTQLWGADVLPLVRYESVDARFFCHVCMFRVQWPIAGVKTDQCVPCSELRHVWLGAGLPVSSEVHQFGEQRHEACYLGQPALCEVLVDFPVVDEVAKPETAAVSGANGQQL